MAAALLAPAADGIWWRAGGLAAGAVALGVLQAAACCGPGLAGGHRRALRAAAY